MTLVANIFQYIFPVVVIAIAIILLCFYIVARKKRASYNASMPVQGDNPSSACHTISLPEDQDTRYDRFPPRYSTVDLPPPYSLFDPKLTGIGAGSPPPAYEMYPITLPLAPHHWSTPAASQQPTSPSSPRNHSNPHPERSHRTSSS